jgi:hypothetical protein
MKTLEKGKAMEDSEVKKITELTGEFRYMTFTLLQRLDFYIALSCRLLLLLNSAFCIYFCQ